MLSFHPLADIFPLMAGAEFDELVSDIRENGLREPITLLDGLILDGRNRYRAATEAGITDIPSTEYAGDDPVGFVISLNLRRRHLSEGQRAWVAAKLATLPKGANQYGSANLQTLPSAAEAAGLLNVSERSVASARVVRDHGISSLQEAVSSGAIAPSVAADLARLPEEDQQAIVAKSEREILDAAKAIRSQRADKKRAARDARLIALSGFNAPLPDRKYSIILADPPWRYDFSPSTDRSVENHYETMEIEAIMALDVGSLATPDAMLFLWAPPSFIEKGLAVMHAWGFDLATSMVWVKTDGPGTGIYVRQCHEYLILGKRGTPITPRPGSQPNSVIHAPRGEHSEKPDETYGIIEKMYPGLAKIELFARKNWPGFDAWGADAPVSENAA